MASLSDPMIQELLAGRYVATLGTRNPDGSIHMVAVWYLFTDGKFYVATSSRAKKSRNLKATANASLMVDSREPLASRGVTCAGAVDILEGAESQLWNERIHKRYLSEAARADKRIGPVFAQWDDITLRIDPTSVFSWDMRVADQQVFGGALEANPGYLLPLER